VDGNCCLYRLYKSVFHHLLRVLYDLSISENNYSKVQAKEEQIKSIQSSAKDEIRFCSAVVETLVNSVKAVSEINVKTAVREVIETEDRSKNFIIHGLSEEAEKNLTKKVLLVFERNNVLKFD